MMKLYLNKASPYARLVQVVAYEKELSEQIALVWTDPWASSEELLAVNPFSKVPALTINGASEDGLIESTCICQHLDDIGSGRRLLPASGAARISALRKYGRGHALIDSAFGVVIERRFAADMNKAPLADRWLTATYRGIAAIALATESLHDEGEPDIGDLAIAVGLAYIEFRLREVEWRRTAPRLGAWLDAISQRASMKQSAPD